MDDLLLCLVNYGHMLLVNVFLVNDWLDVLVDDRHVMLVDHILMYFLDNVLVMLMNYFSVRFLDDWLLDNSVDNGCLLMGKDLCLAHITLEDRSFFMSDHSRCGHLNSIQILSHIGSHVGCHSSGSHWHGCSHCCKVGSLHNWSCSLNECRLWGSSLDVNFSFVNYLSLLLLASK